MLPAHLLQPPQQDSNQVVNSESENKEIWSTAALPACTIHLSPSNQRMFAILPPLFLRLQFPTTLFTNLLISVPTWQSFSVLSYCPRPWLPCPQGCPTAHLSYWKRATPSPVHTYVAILQRAIALTHAIVGQFFIIILFIYYYYYLFFYFINKSYLYIFFHWPPAHDNVYQPTFLLGKQTAPPFAPTWQSFSVHLSCTTAPYTQWCSEDGNHPPCTLRYLAALFFPAFPNNYSPSPPPLHPPGSPSVCISPAPLPHYTRYCPAAPKSSLPPPPPSEPTWQSFSVHLSCTTAPLQTKVS